MWIFIIILFFFVQKSVGMSLFIHLFIPFQVANIFLVYKNFIILICSFFFQSHLIFYKLSEKSQQKILLVPAKIRNNCGRYYLIINFAIIDFSLLLLVRTLLHCFFSVLLIIAIVGIAITLERTNKKQKTNSGIFYEGADFISRGWGRFHFEGVEQKYFYPGQNCNRGRNILC